MTQQYGQQPGNYGQQPGGYPGHPQQGGYPQQPTGYPSPPGGFPQPTADYPQAPGYPASQGGYPQAPTGGDQELRGGRPGSATAAAVLGFVQAAATTITTAVLLLAISGGGADLVLAWVLVLSQAAGIVLLIWGGIRLLSGTGRGLYLAGTILEIALSAFWLFRFVTVETGGFQPAESVTSFGVYLAILFAVLPVIGLLLGLGGATKRYAG